MTNRNEKRLLALAIAVIGAGVIGGGVVLAQTKQLKAPASAPKVVTEAPDEDAAPTIVAPNGTSSYSVVIENRTTPDGKVIQSKKVWSNGALVQEEEKEIDADEAISGLGATIQLPNGQVAPGGIFQSEDSDDVFGSDSSPFDVIRRMEEQMRAQEEQMRAQFEALRNRIASGLGSDPRASNNNRRFPSQNPLTTPSKYWIGLTIGSIPEILMSQLPIEENEGALVQYVVPDSPAGRISLKLYDVLYSINGQVISNPSEVTEIVNSLGAKKVRIEYYRKGKLESAEIEIEERPKTLGSPLMLGAPLQNKKFQVVRPGLIVPSEEIDSFGGAEADDTDTTDASTSTGPENESTDEVPVLEDLPLQE